METNANTNKVKDYFDRSYVYVMFTLDNLCQDSENINGKEILEYLRKNVNSIKELYNEEEIKFVLTIVSYQFLRSIEMSPVIKLGFVKSILTGDKDVLKAFVEFLNEKFNKDKDAFRDIRNNFDQTLNDILDNKEENSVVYTLTKEDENFAKYYEENKYPVMV